LVWLSARRDFAQPQVNPFRKEKLGVFPVPGLVIIAIEMDRMAFDGQLGFFPRPYRCVSYVLEILRGIFADEN